MKILYSKNKTKQFFSFSLNEREILLVSSYRRKGNETGNINRTTDRGKIAKIQCESMKTNRLLVNKGNECKLFYNIYIRTFGVCSHTRQVLLVLFVTTGTEREERERERERISS